MEKVDDKNRNFRFLCCKNFARDVNFFIEKLFFSSRVISYHWMGGKGGHARGSLCILISNVCERYKNKTRAAFELGNTVVGVRPNLRHM